MNNDTLNKIYWAVGSTVAAIFLVVVLHLGGTVNNVISKLGTVANNFSNLTSLSLSGIFEMTGAGGSASTGLQQQVSVGTCGTASSTIFSVQNPFTATSTLALFEIWGTESATSSDIVVATSTQPSFFATSSTVGVPNIVGITALTASKQFFTEAGVPIGPSTGYTVPNSGTYPTSQKSVVVGPNDYVVGFSTSTSVASGAGGGSAATLGIPTSCSYKMLWVSQ